MLGFGGFGLAIVFVVWALTIAGVARIAVGRGRSPVGWALGAAIASGLGVTAGAQLALRILSDAADSTSGLGFATLSIVLPLVGLIVPVAVLAFVLAREPIKVASGDLWQVHFIDRGPGTVRFTGDTVRFEWADGSHDATRAELEGIEPDGECVRLRLGDRELAILPLGKPETPEGRRQQSRALALRLRR